MGLKEFAKNDSHSTPFVDIDCLTWFDGNLLSSDSSGSVKIWSPDLKLLSQFNPHGEYPVYHFATNEVNKTLFTCSSDAKIHEWKFEKGAWTAINTFEGHGDQTVRRLALCGHLLFSGDEGGQVNVWENGTQVASFDFMEEIWDMLVIEKTLVTVRNRDVVLSDIVPSTQEDSKFRACIRQVLPGRPPLLLAGDKLCFADRNGMEILVASGIQSGSPQINKLQGHTLIVNAFASTGKTLFSGGWDKKIMAWDIEKCEGIESLDTAGYINAMTCSGSGDRLYAAGENSFISAIQIS